VTEKETFRPKSGTPEARGKMTREKDYANNTMSKEGQHEAILQEEKEPVEVAREKKIYLRRGGDPQKPSWRERLGERRGKVPPFPDHEKGYSWKKK